jgi:hypothetical protein
VKFTVCTSSFSGDPDHTTQPIFMPDGSNNVVCSKEVNFGGQFIRKGV